MSVPICSILDRKGHDVYTVPPEAGIADALRLLREHDIGALVVSASGTDIAGIVSERDIVRHLADEGPGCFDRTVSELMTERVTTCDRADTADHLMSIMTERRIRHVPVLDDGRMIGIVSIRDIVKSHTDELELTTAALTNYVTGSAY